ncbi:MAG: polysaccharide deacetylase family protein, partial [Candidatus Hinthialibacter sp.]
GRGETIKSYAPIVSQKFLTGRGWLDESSNDPWFCDFPQLLGMESDGKSFDELKKLVDRAAKERRWLILAGHEMGDSGNQTTLLSSLEKLFHYAQAPDSGIWIDTVASIAEYVHKVRSETE